MNNALVEHQIEKAFGNKAVRIMKQVGKLASKQGGATAVENYQLLGKRTLIALCAAVATVQIAASAIGLAVSRKSEEQRIERIVRRVLEEERQREQPAPETQ